jgi:hypothetical protein
MFSSEVVVRGSRNRRGAPRSKTAFDTDLRLDSAATRAPCRIIDISSGGARLRLYQDLAPETAIQIALPVKGLIDAHIVWANGHEAGCRFVRPLDEATVARLQATVTERRAGN